MVPREENRVPADPRGTDIVHSRRDLSVRTVVELELQGVVCPNDTTAAFDVGLELRYPPNALVWLLIAVVDAEHDGIEGAEVRWSSQIEVGETDLRDIEEVPRIDAVHDLLDFVLHKDRNVKYFGHPVLFSVRVERP